MRIYDELREHLNVLGIDYDARTLRNATTKAHRYGHAKTRLEREVRDWLAGHGALRPKIQNVNTNGRSVTTLTRITRPVKWTFHLVYRIEVRITDEYQDFNKGFTIAEREASEIVKSSIVTDLPCVGLNLRGMEVGE